MTLVLKKAPSFNATAVVKGEVVKDFTLEQFQGEKYVVLFFYPKDFSGVCPTEMWAFQERSADFEKRNAVVIGCSTDSEESHKVWLSMPREKNGIADVHFPIIADHAKTIASNYGILGGDFFYDEEGKLAFEGSPIALRGTFIINKAGVVMYESINFFTIARDIDQILRELDALQHFEQKGEVCLANWKKQ
ncbi:MAG: peroxiredoxin [Cytophagales bacterium]|nr:MAG: peroxiredoxin [Cytophagales bacterium]